MRLPSRTSQPVQNTSARMLKLGFRLPKPWNELEKASGPTHYAFLSLLLALLRRAHQEDDGDEDECHEKAQEGAKQNSECQNPSRSLLQLPTEVSTGAHGV